MADSGGSDDPSDPASWNRYSYTEGDPINYYDPEGLLRQCPTGTHAENNSCVPDDGGDGGGGGVGVDKGSKGKRPFKQPNPDKPTKPGPSPGGPLFDVKKSYTTGQIPCDKSAAQVMSDVENNFSQFGNFSTTVNGLPSSVKFSPPAGQLTVGESIPINITVGGGLYSLNTSVIVTGESSSQLIFQTVPGHLLYPASITFSDMQGANGIYFNINLAGDFGGRLQHVLFNLGGGSFEDQQWNNFLGNVESDCLH